MTLTTTNQRTNIVLRDSPSFWKNMKFQSTIYRRNKKRLALNQTSSHHDGSMRSLFTILGLTAGLNSLIPSTGIDSHEETKKTIESSSYIVQPNGNGLLVSCVILGGFATSLNRIQNMKINSTRPAQATSSWADLFSVIARVRSSSSIQPVRIHRNTVAISNVNSAKIPVLGTVAYVGHEAIYKSFYGQ